MSCVLGFYNFILHLKVSLAIAECVIYNVTDVLTVFFLQKIALVGGGENVY